MPRGYPDWGVVTAQLGAPEFDTGEMAARIGSPYSYLRRGKVLYIDSFELGFNAWERYVLGNGSIAMTTFQVYHGAKAVKLTPPTAAPNQSSLQKVFPRVVGRRIGIEVYFAMEDAANEAIFTLDYNEIKDDKFVYWSAQIDSDNNRLLHRNGIVLATLPNRIAYGGATAGEMSWHHLKSVIDLVSQEQIEIWFDGTLYEPTNKTPQVVAAGGWPDATRVDMLVYETASQAAVYVDAFTLSVDE